MLRARRDAAPWFRSGHTMWLAQDAESAAEHGCEVPRNAGFISPDRRSGVRRMRPRRMVDGSWLMVNGSWLMVHG